MDNSLQHWGIKGMRWGVRRFRKKDGSLTSAGKKRYSDDAHDDYKKAHDNKSLKSMSDAELRARNNRLQMEAQYNNLTKKKVSAGRKFATTILVGAATTVATSYANDYAKKGAAWLGKEIADHAGSALIRRAITK